MQVFGLWEEPRTHKENTQLHPHFHDEPILIYEKFLFILIYLS